MTADDGGRVFFAEDDVILKYIEDEFDCYHYSIYRVVFIFGSLLIWAYTVLQDARSLLMQISSPLDFRVYFLQKCA